MHHFTCTISTPCLTLVTQCASTLLHLAHKRSPCSIPPFQWERTILVLTPSCYTIVVLRLNRSMQDVTINAKTTSYSLIHNWNGASSPHRAHNYSLLYIAQIDFRTLIVQSNLPLAAWQLVRQIASNAVRCTHFIITMEPCPIKFQAYNMASIVLLIMTIKCTHS